VTEVFADTSFLIAVMSERDEWHALARRLSATISGRMVTTEWVLVELGNYLAKSPLRNTFTRFIDDLDRDPAVVVLTAEAASFDAGLELFASRPDKNWSLVDCISFTVMSERGITNALTADHHFEQAGLRVLLT
jgi:uncharacterized protein